MALKTRPYPTLVGASGISPRERENVAFCRTAQSRTPTAFAQRNRPARLRKEEVSIDVWAVATAGAPATLGLHYLRS